MSDHVEHKRQVEYCDRCIRYGNDVNNPVKHNPEDCPVYGYQHRAANGHPDIDYGNGITPRFPGLTQDQIDSIPRAAVWPNDRDTAIQDFGEYKESVYRRNSPIRKPGLAITPEQEQLIRSHLESGDITAAQQVVIDSLDEWSVNNPPQNFRGTNDELSVSLPAVTTFSNSQAIRAGHNLGKMNLCMQAMGCGTPVERALTYSTGTIRRYFPTRGYGFIKPDCGGIDVWIHVNNCVGGYRPVEGDRVNYLTRLGKEGLIAKETDRLVDKVVNIDFGGIQYSAEGLFQQHMCQAVQQIGAEVNNQYDRDTPEREQQKQSMYDVICGKRS